MYFFYLLWCFVICEVVMENCTAGATCWQDMAMHHNNGPHQELQTTRIRILLWVTRKPLEISQRIPNLTFLSCCLFVCVGIADENNRKLHSWCHLLVKCVIAS